MTPEELENMEVYLPTTKGITGNPPGNTLVPQDQVCPRCGRCPHCGHTPDHYRPYIPQYPYPVYPYYPPYTVTC